MAHLDDRTCLLILKEIEFSPWVKPDLTIVLTHAIASHLEGLGGIVGGIDFEIGLIFNHSMNG